MTVSTPPAPPVPLTRRQIVAWRNAVFFMFALPGIAFASWASRVPAVRDSLGASTDQMGVILSGMAVGSVLGLLASGRIVARFGARRTMVVTLTAASVGVTIAGIGATAGAFWVVFAGLTLVGAGSGICDVAMNVTGAANERALGRAIMPIFHAFFSFGTMVGAALGALAEVLDIPVAVHFGVIAVLVAIGVFLAVRPMQAEHFGGVGEPAEEGPRRRGMRLDLATLLIGLVVLAAAFSEGSANDWLALAMVDGHDVSRENGAIVFGVFLTAMTVARLLGVRALDKWGRVPVLRVSFALAAVGLLAVIFAPTPLLAAVGAVAWGFGSALGFPVGMSAAADDPAKAAARVGAVATIGYFAFLVGPPSIGFLGEHFGILPALLVVLVLVTVGGLVAAAVREPKAAPTE
ncbi:MFS transporter [Naasia sp. SYSU D00057]|uniref:MFS transporter n=1 Tax=Naasia sp. SYSU D00057 TaxID=2817380 RepID=UPI001B3169B1|nr:MFS transporter [Naasia sp. SYSU D00057]